MAKEKTVYGTEAAKLAELLSVGTNPRQALERGSAGQQKADLIRDLLSAKLPLPQGSKSDPMDCFRTTIEAALSKPIGQLLSDTDIAMGVLQQIKAHGAGVSRASSSDIEREAANVLYYAALAAALVFHGQRITEFSYEELCDRFTKLIALPWITMPLCQLFKQARDTSRDFTKKESRE